MSQERIRQLVAEIGKELGMCTPAEQKLYGALERGLRIKLAGIQTRDEALTLYAALLASNARFKGYDPVKFLDDWFTPSRVCCLDDNGMPSCTCDDPACCNFAELRGVL